jgi:hypothetical protein
MYISSCKGLYGLRRPAVVPPPAWRVLRPWLHSLPGGQYNAVEVGEERLLSKITLLSLHLCDKRRRPSPRMNQILATLPVLDQSVPVTTRAITRFTTLEQISMFSIGLERH